MKNNYTSSHPYNLTTLYQRTTLTTLTILPLKGMPFRASYISSSASCYATDALCRGVEVNPPIAIRHEPTSTYLRRQDKDKTGYKMERKYINTCSNIK